MGSLRSEANSFALTATASQRAYAGSESSNAPGSESTLQESVGSYFSANAFLRSSVFQPPEKKKFLTRTLLAISESAMRMPSDTRSWNFE